MSYQTVGQQIQMGYQQQNFDQNRPRVTKIDDLLDLDAEIDDRTNFQNQAMNRNIRMDSHGLHSVQPQGMRPQMQQMQRQMQPMHVTPIDELDNAQPVQQEQPNPQPRNIKTYEMPDNTPSCLDVAEHIANCPICSKFYNNDKTLYIVAIVILAVICVILLKKVIDGSK